MSFTETCPRLSVGYGRQDGQCMRCSTTCLEFFTRVKDSRMNITSGLIGQNGHMILLECKQCASIFFGLIFLCRWESDYFHEAMHKRFLKAPTLPSEKILNAVGIGQEGRAKSSSWDGDVYIPVFAIDGKISTIFEYFFHSKRENYPWFQLWIPEGNVTGVTIVPRYDYDTQRFQNIEFRAGMTTVVDGFKGRLTINEKVGFFTGPAVPGENYTITFDTTVLAKYITIQRMQESAVLEINEVTLL